MQEREKYFSFLQEPVRTSARKYLAERHGQGAFNMLRLTIETWLPHGDDKVIEMIEGLNDKYHPLTPGKRRKTSDPSDAINDFNYIGVPLIRMICSKFTTPDVLKKFLSMPGVDVNLYSGGSDLALSMAILLQKNDLVKVLLEHKDIDVNKLGGGSKTPLMCAYDNIEALELLLKSPRIDLEAKDLYDHTALENAVLGHLSYDDKPIYLKYVQILLEHGARITDEAKNKAKGEMKEMLTEVEASRAVKLMFAQALAIVEVDQHSFTPTASTASCDDTDRRSDVTVAVSPTMVIHPIARKAVAII